MPAVMVRVTCSASRVLSNSLSLQSGSVILTTTPGQGEISLPQEGKRHRQKLLFGPQGHKGKPGLIPFRGRARVLPPGAEHLCPHLAAFLRKSAQHEEALSGNSAV